MSGHNDPKLVHASLARMGTMSMAEAYRILGFRPHHYHQLANPDKEADWPAFERAVDGKWPHVKGAKSNRTPFTRADWDALLGEKYDFFTDLYAHFTPDHIRAYPEAKVVIVERDFESWWPSYRQVCIEFLLQPTTRLIAFVLRHTKETSQLDALGRQYKGVFGVPDLRMINEVSARKMHTEFFEEVQRMVPPERKLHYKLGEGWEPLCKFLDKPVPDVPFPRLNERAVLLKKYETIRWGTILVVSSLAVAAVGVIWYALGL